MKKVNLSNLYESSTPPSDTKSLWMIKDHKTGDIKVIFRYKKGNWEPYLVSVDYLREDTKVEDNKK